MELARDDDSSESLKLSNLKKTPVSNLVLGMYVARLDKPWLETAFKVQGFFLRSNQAIERVRETCDYVYVDPRRYDSSLVDSRKGSPAANKTSKKVPTKAAGKKRIMPAKPHVYADTRSFDEEVQSASPALNNAMQEVERCLSRVEKGGQFDGESFQEAVKPVIKSVVRNQDAVAALVRVRQFDQYLYSHSISCAVWAALLGRELGFPPDQLEEISLACSLMDLGKTKLPKSLLAKQAELSDDDVSFLREHVEIGLSLLSEGTFANNPHIENVIKTHHERHNGSGYPNGLASFDIPLFGRIAGLVDTYDAMISERPYAPATPSYQVLLDLEKNADVLFQKPLVDYFIKAVGIFPVGSVVELNTGEVGIVTKQSEDQRLRPRVMLVLDENKLPRAESSVINLASTDDSQVTTWITRELPKGVHNIDVEAYFLK